MGGKIKVSWWAVLKGAGKDFSEDKALRLSAAMAYYAIFSLGPLLFFVVGIAGLVLGEESVRTALQEQLKSLMGAQSSGILDSMMSARKTGGSLVATIIGGIGLLMGASGIFGQLQDALNTIWEVKAKAGGGVWSFLRNRFLSFGMVLVIGFLLLVSMVMTTVVAAGAGYLSKAVGVPEAMTHSLTFLANFVVMTVLFAAIFKFLPDVKIGWGDVWVGAIATALLFTIGKFILGWYLGRESTTSAYGAAGAFIVILLYIYYSTIILFFGAEFTQVYAKSRGTRIVPSAHAEPVTDDERSQQGMQSGEKTPGKPGTAPGRGARAGSPAYAYSSKGNSMKPLQTRTRAYAPNPFRAAPLEQIKARPYSFVGLAVAAGVGAGLLFKFRNLRTGLKWYLAARRIF